MLGKCEFWNSTFENCQIENCNLTKSAFYNGSFKDSNFRNVNLTASVFFDFEFIKTKFKNSKLDFILFSSIKVSNSKQSIEIEKSSNLEKILKDMNLITEHDEIENY